MLARRVAAQTAPVPVSADDSKYDKARWKSRLRGATKIRFYSACVLFCLSILVLFKVAPSFMPAPICHISLSGRTGYNSEVNGLYKVQENLHEDQPYYKKTGKQTLYLYYAKGYDNWHITDVLGADHAFAYGDANEGPVEDVVDWFIYADEKFVKDRKLRAICVDGKSGMKGAKIPPAKSETKSFKPRKAKVVMTERPTRPPIVYPSNTIQPIDLREVIDAVSGECLDSFMEYRRNNDKDVSKTIQRNCPILSRLLDVYDFERRFRHDLPMCSWSKPPFKYLPQHIERDKHQDVIRYFNYLNLGYWLTGDTALGAVRHGGMLPFNKVKQCRDDPKWDSGFGGCDSYVPEGDNHKYCTADTDSDGVLAERACPRACGTCSGVEMSLIFPVWLNDMSSKECFDAHYALLPKLNSSEPDRPTLCGATFRDWLSQYKYFLLDSDTSRKIDVKRIKTGLKVEYEQTKMFATITMFHSHYLTYGPMCQCHFYDTKAVCLEKHPELLKKRFGANYMVDKDFSLNPKWENI